MPSESPRPSPAADQKTPVVSPTKKLKVKAKGISSSMSEAKIVASFENE